MLRIVPLVLACCAAVCGAEQDLAAPIPAPQDAQAPSHSIPQPATNGATPANPMEPVAPAAPLVDPLQRQPKRILGVMPNYRAISAGAIPPPPTAKESFVLATQNTFDYSSFIFVGLTSLIAKGEDEHPDLGKGVPGMWAYTWRGFVDKADGNYLVLFALPTLLREDERYYAMGHGKKLHRAIYSVDQVFVARSYRGRNTLNAAELFGRGIAQGLSATYYPGQDRNATDVSEKFAYAVMRDALTNAFREFWPDIATHVLHMKQQ